MSENAESTEAAEDNSAKIIRDVNSIKLFCNENNYISIEPDKIVIKGTIILDGDVKITTAAAGVTVGTSIGIFENGQFKGNW